MKTITWEKRDGRGEDAPVIGNLSMTMPTWHEWDSLPEKLAEPGWSKEAVFMLMERAAKVDNAAEFVRNLKIMGRKAAELKSSEYKPCTTKLRTVTGVTYALRMERIHHAKKLAAANVDLETIRTIMSDVPDLESILIAAGLMEDTDE